MASLVGMEEERAGKPTDRIELPEHVDDEGHAHRLGERPGDDLVGRRVLGRPVWSVRACPREILRFQFFIVCRMDCHPMESIGGPWSRNTSPPYFPAEASSRKMPMNSAAYLTVLGVAYFT